MNSVECQRGGRSAWKRRGFTLVEILTVIGMISVLAVAASPTFVQLMRDRRVNRAAMHLVDYYRTGRTRAMGRGQPMLVVWDTTNGASNSEPGTKGMVRLLEPIVAAAVSLRCSEVAWNARTGGQGAAVQEVSRVDFKNGLYTYTSASFVDDLGQPQNYAEVCFSPSGRTYIRGTEDAFRPLTGVPYFKVNNAALAYGPTRKVFVPPNGVSRMQL